LDLATSIASTTAFVLQAWASAIDIQQRLDAKLRATAGVGLRTSEACSGPGVKSKVQKAQARIER
jgi:hypothetical protein